MSYKNKFDRLTNAPVKGLITSLAIPTILTMLVTAIYNTADSYFVGKIDTSSVASIGIVFSVMTFLQAIGFFIGQGSGIMISTSLGEKDRNAAEIYANTAVFTSLLLGVILAVTGLFLATPIARSIGSTPTTLKNAADYLRIILLGSPFILASFVINNHLRYQGSAVYSMTGIISGSLLNIALDPLFIFKLNLGVKGAAIATVISQFISFVLLIFGTAHSENIRISLKKFRPSRRVYLDIFRNGLPSLARQGVNTVGNIVMNYSCSRFGDAAIAGMSVYNRVMFLGIAIVIGYGQGFQPVCSFNNGAGKHKRVYEGYKFTATVTTVIISVIALFGFIFAPQLISLFRDDSEVVDIGVKALRAQCVALPLTGYVISSNMLAQSLKFSGRATVLAVSRLGIFYVPLMLILPLFIGKTGIIITQPLADLCTFILTIILMKNIIKDLKAKGRN
jgi:putative MATE family efflux protein